ncbi:MAG: DEAD/DEAH box helicase [Mycoplasmataceae bacterium]|nr:DEAD/DEAH box helicase [Mycoplasmataceae bacterium]
MDLKSYNLRQEIIDYIEFKKFDSFLPVQKKSIPDLIRGKDSFVEAPTGTGKTLTFLIPILQNLNVASEQTQSIIIVPTRELAIQIHNVLKEMKPFFKDEIKSVLSIGGMDFNDQLRKINNGSHIIIGTLDRINSLRSETSHDLSYLQYLILDEVDMIFNFGGFEDILEIFDNMPTTTTLGFFSASFPLELQNYIKKLFKKEISNIIIKIEDDLIISSHYIKAHDGDKMQTLINLLNSNTFNPYFALIFAKTNEEVEKIYLKLKQTGIKDIGIFHSKIEQRERNRLLKSINNSELIYLVTTDLMSRGMDFPGVTHIVNYSLPVDLIYYKHRIGRTNRNSVMGNIYDIYIDSDVIRYEEISKKNPNIKFIRTKVK